LLESCAKWESEKPLCCFESEFMFHSFGKIKSSITDKGAENERSTTRVRSGYKKVVVTPFEDHRRRLDNRSGDRFIFFTAGSFGRLRSAAPQG